MATVLGWHRAFCFRVARFRGTRDKPGLMLALDRGGKCKGMIFRLPADQVEASLDTLFRREVMVKPAVNMPRWMTAVTIEGRREYWASSSIARVHIMLAISHSRRQSIY